MLRYDSLASAVRNILRGYRREETVRLWRSARIGGLPRNSARPVKGMRRAALKAKVTAATSQIPEQYH
jgi:hypothetical protein